MSVNDIDGALVGRLLNRYLGLRNDLVAEVFKGKEGRRLLYYSSRSRPWRLYLAGLGRITILEEVRVDKVNTSLKAKDIGSRNFVFTHHKSKCLDVIRRL